MERRRRRRRQMDVMDQCLLETFWAIVVISIVLFLIGVLL